MGSQLVTLKQLETREYFRHFAEQRTQVCKQADRSAIRNSLSLIDTVLDSIRYVKTNLLLSIFVNLRLLILRIPLMIVNFVNVFKVFKCIYCLLASYHQTTYPPTPTWFLHGCYIITPVLLSLTVASCA